MSAPSVRASMTSGLTPSTSEGSVLNYSSICEVGESLICGGRHNQGSSQLDSGLASCIRLLNIWLELNTKKKKL